MGIIGNKPGFNYPHKKQTMVYSSGVDISSPWLVQLQELDGDATEMFPLAENGEDPAAALQLKKKKNTGGSKISFSKIQGLGYFTNPTDDFMIFHGI